MKARRAVGQNWVRPTATNASASEQMARSTARRARTRTESRPGAARSSDDERGDDGLQRRRRRGPDDEEAAGVEHVVLSGGHEAP